VIVRILDGGQFEIDDAHSERFAELDGAMLAAIESEDEEAFRSALDDVLAAIHEHGAKVDPAHIKPSDLVVPASDATLEEVRILLASEEDAEPEESVDAEA
jgi:hypothetical protein